MNPQSSVAKQNWDLRVKEILRSVRRRGTMLMLLGYVIYGGGTAALLIFMKDKALATVLVMFFFQLMVLYFGTREMFPAIQGAFRIGLEANRDSVPLFEKMADGVHRLETDPGNHPLVQEIGNRIDRVIESKLMPVVDTWARIGDRLEKHTIPQFEKAIVQLNASEQKIDAKISSTVEGIKRVQQHIEGELATGILREIREAAQVVKLMGMQHSPPPMPLAASAAPRVSAPMAAPAPVPASRDFSTILTSLRKGSNGSAAPAASQGGRA